MKTKVIPVTTGATGTISKSLKQYLSNIQGKHEIKELQKLVILGTAHVLVGKYKIYLPCEITLHVTLIAYTEQLQRYIP